MVSMRVSEVVFACHSRVCAPPPVGRGGSSAGHSSSATHAAFRGAHAITQTKSGSVTTVHKGRNWEIRAHDKASKEVYHAKGRSSSTAGALNRLVKEYERQARG